MTTLREFGQKLEVKRLNFMEDVYKPKVRYGRDLLTNNNSPWVYDEKNRISGIFVY